MVLTTLTMNVAKEIMTAPKWELDRFHNEASCNNYISFSHYRFYYSYPAWGKVWADGKTCQFHKVETRCHLCGFKPERNFAGIGSLYLLHNGVSDAHILTGKPKQMKYVPNTPRLSQMILLCPDHVASYFPFHPYKQVSKTVLQLQLF